MIYGKLLYNEQTEHFMKDFVLYDEKITCFIEVNYDRRTTIKSRT